MTANTRTMAVMMNARRLLCLSAGTTALTIGCQLALAEAARGLQTRAFDCGVVPVLVVLLADNATVYLPERGMTLTRSPDSNLTEDVFADEYSRLSINGHTARLRIAQRRYPACRENTQRAFWQAAQLRDASFRAAAPDLSWTLDLMESGSTRVLRYAASGSATLWFRQVSAHKDAPNAWRYAGEAGTHRIRVSVSVAGPPCAVPALASTLSARVVLNLDGQEQLGCGGSVP